MTKPDGRIFVGLQRHVQSGDASRDVAGGDPAGARVDAG